MQYGLGPSVFFFASWSFVHEDDFVQKFGSRRVKTNNGHFDHLRSKEVLTLEQYLKQNVSEWNLFFADMAYSLQRSLARLGFMTRKGAWL